MKELLILIPARGGSKGIPRKNMALLGGKPLIEYTIRAAIAANLPGRMCLSTDDEEIRNFGLGFPLLEAPFLRPEELAQDDSGTIPVIFHALDWYEKNEDFFPDYLLLLQPTCPFRKQDDIIKAYNQIISAGANSLTSVNLVRDHPCEYIMKSENSFKYVLPPPVKPGRQNFPEVFFINGAIYISKVSFIKKKGMLLDNTSQLYVMDQRNSIDIDMPSDLDYANWLADQSR